MKKLVLGRILLVCFLFTSSLAQAADKWNSLNVIDVDEFAWDKEPRFKSKTKTILRGPNNSSLIYAQFAPRWDMFPPMDPLGPHYHHWHEWAYVLDGDFVIHEPVSATQKSAMLSHFQQGTWLDRPAYTLHGGVWEIGGMRAQNACTLIIFEEGDGSVVTLGPKGDHFKPDFPDKPVPYNPDWQSVKNFEHPWIVHSATDLEWENDPSDSGKRVKWLSDSRGDGFRGRMVKIPPGWKAGADDAAHYFKKANRMIYMLYGDVTLQQYRAPGKKAEKVKLEKDYFVHQPEKSIFAFAEGSVSENGAVWLEVTYAKGLSVGGGEIEAPVTLK